jgi:hypothetical protein
MRTQLTREGWTVVRKALIGLAVAVGGVLFVWTGISWLRHAQLPSLQEVIQLFWNLIFLAFGVGVLIALVKKPAPTIAATGVLLLCVFVGSCFYRFAYDDKFRADMTGHPTPVVIQPTQPVVVRIDPKPNGPDTYHINVATGYYVDLTSDKELWLEPDHKGPLSEVKYVPPASFYDRNGTKVAGLAEFSTVNVRPVSATESASVTWFLVPRHN